mmetsp:Transcript_54815/g.156048  ORF Transcript_54815/g.156048 Transcript_54815/m.156048 type:complete len:208 (-) Transcript_54815:125-748(-)
MEQNQVGLRREPRGRPPPVAQACLRAARAPQAEQAEDHGGEEPGHRRGDEVLQKAAQEHRPHRVEQGLDAAHRRVTARLHGPAQTLRQVVRHIIHFSALGGAQLPDVLGIKHGCDPLCEVVPPDLVRLRSAEPAGQPPLPRVTQAVGQLHPADGGLVQLEHRAVRGLRCQRHRPQGRQLRQHHPQVEGQLGSQRGLPGEGHLAQLEG